MSWNFTTNRRWWYIDGDDFFVTAYKGLPAETQPEA